MIDPEKVMERVVASVPISWSPSMFDLSEAMSRVGSNVRAIATAIVLAVVETVNAELAATAAALESGDPAMLEQAACLLMQRFGERLKESAL